MQLVQPLNRYIDHTLLKPNAAWGQFQQLVLEAVQHNFASVCVSPHVALPAVNALSSHPDVKVCTVVGFPHGNLPLRLKVAEAKYFAENGVDEIDFVVNIGELKSGMYQNVGCELEDMGALCKEHGVVSKCIIETCYLTPDEKTFMYRALAEKSAVDFIKTSTGFGLEDPSGAFLGDVLDWNQRRHAAGEPEKTGELLILNRLPTNEYLARNGQPLKIKAAGGIKDLETALKFIACGAGQVGNECFCESDGGVECSTVNFHRRRRDELRREFETYSFYLVSLFFRIQRASSSGSS